MTRRDVILLLAVCAIGLVLRVSWIAYIQPQADNDAAGYRNLGWQLSHGQDYGRPAFRSWRPPGYPLLIAAAYGVGLDSAKGCLLIDIICSVLAPLLMTMIIWRVSGPTLGRWALYLLVLNPVFIGSAAISMSQGPAAVFLYASLLCALFAAAESNGRRALLWCVGSGLALGYGALVRQEILLAFPFVAAYLYFKGRQKSLLTPILLLAAALVVILPWTVRNWRWHNAFVLISTNGGEVFYAANASPDPEKGGEVNDENYEKLRALEPVEAKRNGLGFKLGVLHIIQNPGPFLRSMPDRWATYAGKPRYLTGAGFMQPQHKPPRLFTKIFRFSYYLLLLPVLIFASRIWRALMSGNVEVILFLGLYAFFFLVLPCFEVKNITHYPFMGLLVLAAFAAAARPVSEDDNLKNADMGVA